MNIQIMESTARFNKTESLNVLVCSNILSTLCICQHVEVGAKWSTSCERDFQITFLNETGPILIIHSPIVFLKVLLTVSTDSNNGSRRWQAIIWNDDYLILCRRIYSSLGNKMWKKHCIIFQYLYLGASYVYFGISVALHFARIIHGYFTLNGTVTRLPAWLPN